MPGGRKSAGRMAQERTTPEGRKEMFSKKARAAGPKKTLSADPLHGVHILPPKTHFIRFPTALAPNVLL